MARKVRKKLKIVKTRWGFWLGVGGTIGTGLGWLGNIIYLGDRTKQYRDEITNIEEIVKTVSDDEVKNYRNLYKEDTEFMEDKEIKEKIGEIKKRKWKKKRNT